MTIITTQSRVSYAGDNVSTLFPIPFEFFLVTDITAVKTLSNGTTANQVYGIDFTLLNAGVPGGGTYSKTTALLTGEILQIFLNPPITQLSHYLSNSPFPASTLENDIDRQAQISQRLEDQISRAVRAPDGDATPGMILPAAILRALNYLAFDASGNVVSTAALPGTSNTAASLGLALYPQTAAEIAIPVVPSAYQYPPGNPWRYGADGAGGANDIAALAIAASVGAASTGVAGFKDVAPLATYLRTSAEISAGVLPTNYQYGTQPYDIRRYGAKLDGFTDDTSAVNQALLVAGQAVNGSLGSAIYVPIGTCLLSSMIFLPNRVRVIGVSKRGSYFKATAGWTVGNGSAAWSSVTPYVTGNLVTSGGLYIAKQANTNQAPPNATYWNPISAAMFYAQNGYAAGVGQSMFDSTLENVAVDANNVAGLGCVLSSAWQEDCGLRAAMLLNFATYGIRYQDGFGGASLSKIVDTEIFAGTTASPLGVDLTSAMGALSSFMLDISNTSITGNPSAAVNLAAAISVKGNSICCRNVHFETATVGLLSDGDGFISLDDVTGAGGSSLVAAMVQMVSTCTASLVMKEVRRNGATNLLVDGRAAGYGTIGAVDYGFFVINSHDATAVAKGAPFASAWCYFNGTTAGTNAPLAGYNVTSVTRVSAGVYSIALTRPMPNGGNGACFGSCVLTTSGINVASQLVSASSFQILITVAGAATDSSEVHGVIFGG